MRIAILAATLAAFFSAPAGAVVLITNNEAFFIADTDAALLPIDPLVAADETKLLASPTQIGLAKFTVSDGTMSLVGQDVVTRYSQDFLRFGSYGSSLAIDFSPGTTAFGVRLAGNQTTSSVRMCADEACFFFTPPNSGRGIFFGFKDDAGLSRFSLSFSGSQSIDLSSMRVAGAVPEPATWAMLIAGFGLAGSALRRRRQLQPSLA